MNNIDGLNRRKPFNRNCNMCGILFKPMGKFQKLCDKCMLIQRKKGNAKARKTLEKTLLTKFKKRNALTKLRKTETNGE